MRPFSIVLMLIIFGCAFLQPAQGQIAALDPTFVQQGTGLSARVNAVAVQIDDKIIVAGTFSAYNGVGRNGIARLNTDGTLDPTFNPGLGFNAGVNTIALQADGKILVGGDFTTFNGQSAGRLIRLNADGSRDASFYLPLNGDLNNSVNVIKVLVNGQILVGGAFTSLESSTVSQLIRLDSDGVQDLTFVTGALSSLGEVNDIAVQNDGRIIIVGEFTSIASFSAKRIARFNALGLFDSSFISGSGLNGTAHTVAVQADGKILVGGAFTSYNGTATQYIARIGPSGLVDGTFAGEAMFDNEVYKLKLQSDGRILVGGGFAAGPGAVSRSFIARLNVEGTLDFSFETSVAFDLPVRAIDLLTDERLVVGGEFAFFSDAQAPYVALLLNHSIGIQTTIPNAPWCAGASVEIIYTTTGLYNAGNSFTIELSDANGSFANPTNIGMMPTTLGGQIYTTIPPNTPPGTDYALRVVSSSPMAMSEDPVGVYVGLDVITSVEPSISFTTSPIGVICSGQLVTFTATAVNGGATPFYTWYRNGTPVGGSSPTYSDNILQNGNQIWCELSSSENCAIPAIVQSDTLTIVIAPLTAPSATISASPNGQVCQGTPVTFTAIAVNGGAVPSYEWTLNGTSVGTNSETYVNSALVDGAIVQCAVTSSAACSNPVLANSNTIVADILTPVAPAISIVSDLGTTICAGVAVTFAATPLNPGAAPSYFWTVNGIDAGETSALFSSSSLVDGDEIICTLTNTDVCASPSTVVSNALIITVSPNLTPSVSISASPSGQICQGVDVAFTAVASNAGTGPSFAWTRNGLPVGANANTFSSAVLANGDVILCTVTSSDVCVTALSDDSDPIVMDVLPVVIPSVFLVSDLGAIICEGVAVTFTSFVANEGSVPTYAWQVNGVALGISTSTYTSNSLADGASVKCVLTNTDACAIPATVISESITLTVVAPPMAPGAILGNTNICSQDTESYSVAAVAGATSYSWTLPSGWSGSSTTTSIAATSGTASGNIAVTANGACGSSAATTLSLTVGPNFSVYSGTVTVNGANVNSGWIYTLKQQISGVGWEKTDSTQIVNGSYLFSQLPIYGVPFIFKVVAPCQNCVPSYYAVETMSHQWDSTGLSYSLTSDCGGIHVKNLDMVTTQGMLDGICTISGTVFWATGKQAATDPIPLIDVVVEKVPPGNAFTYGQTNANGDYQFENMPVLQGILERYRIYISVPGIPMADTYFIDVNPNDTAIRQLDFYVDTVNNEIYILNPNGIYESLAEVESLRLLPNPMHDRMTVILPAKFGMAVSYRMVSIDGKVVEERALNGNGLITVDRGSLPSGVYFLEVTNSQGLRRAAKVVVH